MKILMAWIGNAQLGKPKSHADAGPLPPTLKSNVSQDAVLPTNQNPRALQAEADSGPIASALESNLFRHAVLLTDQKPHTIQPFIERLKPRTRTEIRIAHAQLSNAMDYGDIHREAGNTLAQIRKEFGPEASLIYFMSSGTPPMKIIWAILGLTRFPGLFLESSKEQGLRFIQIPFELSAELIPALYKKADLKLIAQTSERSSDNAQFGDIVYRSEPMDRLIRKARRVALRSLPVLIEGESGTGKELLARAIANEGPRKDKPFRVINCGAIPAELLESELFGHEKGAFTGATRDRAGYFEEAHTGTLFLDEVGELPLPAQVKFLRVLQESEVTRVGASQPRKVDVRIIAATNRNLIEEVRQGRFREDLFYRLAVAVLKVPALRDREGDLGLLIKTLLDKVNAESAEEINFVPRKLSPGAKNLLLNHTWPGNVRELQNTLLRAVVWSENSALSAQDLEEALLPMRPQADPTAQPFNPEKGMDLPKLLAETARKHLELALKAANGNKQKTARLLRLSSGQLVDKWIKKYEVSV